MIAFPLIAVARCYMTYTDARQKQLHRDDLRS